MTKKQDANEPINIHHSESVHHVEVYDTGHDGQLKMMAEKKDEIIKQITDLLAENYGGGLIAVVYATENGKQHGVQQLVTGCANVMSIVAVAKNLTEVVEELADQGIDLITKDAADSKASGNTPGDDLLNAIKNAMKDGPKE